MKRTIPLIITAIGGFVLIVAYFIPATESWGEAAAIWFDILAAIAFILGGGNLLKVHLKKISDRQAGWGYSGVTIVAFFITLAVGLLKVGVGPAPNQEFAGESFVGLPLSAVPEYSVAGTIPARADGAALPASVRRQLSVRDGSLVFRGWMRPNQKQDLLGFQDELAWRCVVEQLASAAQPPEQLRGRLAYYAEHDALAFRGYMTAGQEEALRGLLSDPGLTPAIDGLADAARRPASVAVAAFPEEFNVPDPFRESVIRGDTELTVKGPLPPTERDAMKREWAHFPVARAMPQDERAGLRGEVESRGRPLNDQQATAFDRILQAGWTADQLAAALNTAGEARPQPRTACELLQDKAAGAVELVPVHPPGDAVTLNDAQRALLRTFADDVAMSADTAAEQLRAAGPFTPGQDAELRTFLLKQPTSGERYRDLTFELLTHGPLTRGQIDFLITEYRLQRRWERDVDGLFAAAHVLKYPWSGEYNQQGSAFWWIYAYVFQPLTATMFALLAFYVASAAFRAFRAKNLEAILLLGTAFIILLGRTFAGVLLTSWVPESIAGFRVENLTIYIMSVFNTAGNRAIMIGVALGVASTSLKVLLGVDRSYLGSGDE
jgi:hypothetical protein